MILILSLHCDRNFFFSDMCEHWLMHDSFVAMYNSHELPRWQSW